MGRSKRTPTSSEDDSPETSMDFITTKAANHIKLFFKSSDSGNTLDVSATQSCDNSTNATLKGRKLHRPTSVTSALQHTCTNETNTSIPFSHKDAISIETQSSHHNERLRTSTQLSSHLVAKATTEELYVKRVGNKNLQKTLKTVGEDNHRVSPNLMKKSVLSGDAEKNYILPPYQESLNQLKKKRRAEKASTKGKGWFDLQATEMTEEKKNDLMVLQYRRSLDPKHFYKAPDIKAIPKFFQIGTVVDIPVDFYHSRIPKKQRKKTLVEELLEDNEFRQYNKRKFAEIQGSQQKGRRAFKQMKRLKKKKR